MTETVEENAQEFKIDFGGDRKAIEFTKLADGGLSIWCESYWSEESIGIDLSPGTVTRFKSWLNADEQKTVT